MGRRKTHEEYVKELKVIKPNIICLEPYIRSNIKIKHQCLKCNYIWSTYPSGLLRKVGCPSCAGVLKKTTEQYNNELKLKNINVICLGKYINNKIKTLHQCLKCNYQWKVKPNTILSNHGCPSCYGNIKKTTEQYKLEIKEKSVICCEEYINALIAIKHQCLICNHIWNIRPNDILTGYGCIKCAGKMLKTHEEYIKELQTVNPNIKCIETYVKALKKIKHQCLICENIFENTPNNILGQNQGCPKCSSSKGEKMISKILNENNIEFIPQKKYKDLFYKSKHRLLSFDFYVPSKNLLIEYNGKQHYEPIEYFGGHKEFKHQQNRDNLKLSYCKNNNIEIIIIRYDQDIVTKLNNSFKKH